MAMSETDPIVAVVSWTAPAIALVALVMIIPVGRRILRRIIEERLRLAEHRSRQQTAKDTGIELSFGARIDEVEKSFPTVELNQPAAPSNAKRIEEITDLSALPPAYVISRAWLRVEDAIARAVANQVASPTTRVSVPPMQLLRIAGDQGLINKDEFHTLNQLRDLRNEAAHSLNPDISLTDALRYDDIADSLVQQIKERTESKRNAPGSR
jgi:hypothetical protein